MTQEKLIQHYESNLEKVKGSWGKPSKYVLAERGEEYVKYAESELEAVKNGRTW